MKIDENPWFRLQKQGLEPGLEACFHHLTANDVPSALRELRAAGQFDRLAPLLCSNGAPLPGPQRHALRLQLAEWKRQRAPSST